MSDSVHVPAPVDARDAPAVQSISLSIAALRGQRVILDAELAALYGVETKRFNEQVKRNAARFPVDFMFQLTADESDSLRSQFATLKAGRGQHRKYLPYAFTEHGALMAAMILNSPRAVEVSIYVVRAFVRFARPPGCIRIWRRDFPPWRRKQSRSQCSTRPSAATPALSCARCSMRFAT